MYVKNALFSMSLKQTSAFKPVAKIQLWSLYMALMVYVNLLIPFALHLAPSAIRINIQLNATIVQTRNHMLLGKNVLKIVQVDTCPMQMQPVFALIAL